MKSQADKDRHAAYMRRYRKKNAVRCREAVRRYRDKNRDAINKRIRIYNRTRRVLNPVQRRNSAYLYRYGITLTQFLSMAKRQGNKCAICRHKRKLNVDHCHGTGRVRGLLCISCNTALGAFSDSTKVVTRALTYLRKAV